MLAVVEHEQQRTRREEVDHGIDELLRRERPDVECTSDRFSDESCVPDRSQLDERSSRFVRRLGSTRELEREPRLADAAGASQREQARMGQQRLELTELALAPYE